MPSTSPAPSPITFDTSKYPYSHHSRLTQLSLKLTHLFATQRAQEQLQLSQYVAQLNGDTRNIHTAGSAAHFDRDDTDSLFDEHKYSSYQHVRAPQNTMEFSQNYSHRNDDNSRLFTPSPQRPASAAPHSPFLAPVANVEPVNASHRPSSPQSPPISIPIAPLGSSSPPSSVPVKPAHTELLRQWQAEEKAHDERSAYHWSQQQTLNALYNDSLRQLIEQHRINKQTLFKQRQQRAQHEQQAADISNHQVETIIAATSIGQSSLQPQAVSDTDRIRLQHAEMHVAEQRWHNQLLSEQTATEKQRISSAELWRQRLDEQLGITPTPLAGETQNKTTVSDPNTIDNYRQAPISAVLVTPATSVSVDNAAITVNSTPRDVMTAVTSITLAPTHVSAAVDLSQTSIPTADAVIVQPQANASFSLSPTPTPALALSTRSEATAPTATLRPMPASSINSTSTQQSQVFDAQADSDLKKVLTDKTATSSISVTTTVTESPTILANSVVPLIVPNVVTEKSGTSKTLASNAVTKSQSVVSVEVADKKYDNDDGDEDDDEEYDNPLNFLRNRQQLKPTPKPSSSVPSSRPTTSSTMKPSALTQNFDSDDEPIAPATATNTQQKPSQSHKPIVTNADDDDDEDEFAGEWTVSNKPVAKALPASATQTLIAPPPKNNSTTSMSSSFSNYQLNPKLASSGSSINSGRSKRLIFSS